MGRNFPIFIDTIPRYEIRGDNMHVVWPDLEIVLPLHIMVTGMAGAHEEVAKWQYRTLDTDKVVNLVPRCGH